MLAVTLIMAVAVVVACAQKAVQKAAETASSASAPPSRPVSATSATPATLATPATQATQATPTAPATPPAAAPSSSPAAGGNGRYTNQRFGFSFDVPAGYAAQTPPADGDGLSFSNTARTATVTGYGGNNVLSRSPSQEMAAAVTTYQAARDSITYRFIHKDVIAVSGTTPHGTVFYQREVVYPAVIYTLLWTYPSASKTQYDALVTQTVDSFVPGPAHSG